MEPSPHPDAGPTSNPNGMEVQALALMEVQAPAVAEDPGPSALWDWGDFLDFAIDDQLLLSFDDVDGAPSNPQQMQVNETEATTTPVGDRVRKRDPRLTCPNFLAGRVPCACPEIDEKLLEEEEPGKKRVRVARNISWGSLRCQVPGCEADISGLKGYHKRHRVCLRCANASSVTLDGVTKRYCQQCAKFHMLSDFDGDKRSCRRKLERHNDRRRQPKVHEHRGPGDMVNQGELHGQGTACDGEAAKGCIAKSE
uniref:Uncharacterized protein MANES_03G189400 n=1 Tax=Rhizophora mucronata TaxID=61149 RepID=A0A2P2PK15_RHIMU